MKQQPFATFLQTKTPYRCSCRSQRLSLLRSHPLRLFTAPPLDFVAGSSCRAPAAPAASRALVGGGAGRRRQSEAAHVCLRRGHEPGGPFSKRGGRPVRIPDGDSSRPRPRCISPAAAATAATAPAAHPDRFAAASLGVSGLAGGSGRRGGRVSAVFGWWSVVPLIRSGTVPSPRFSLRVVAHDSGLVRRWAARSGAHGAYVRRRGTKETVIKVCSYVFFRRLLLRNENKRAVCTCIRRVWRVRPRDIAMRRARVERPPASSKAGSVHRR